MNQEVLFFLVFKSIILETDIKLLTTNHEEKTIQNGSIRHLNKQGFLLFRSGFPILITLRRLFSLLFEESLCKQLLDIEEKFYKVLGLERQKKIMNHNLWDFTSKISPQTIKQNWNIIEHLLPLIEYDCESKLLESIVGDADTARLTSFVNDLFTYIIHACEPIEQTSLDKNYSNESYNKDTPDKKVSQVIDEAPSYLDRYVHKNTKIPRFKKEKRIKKVAVIVPQSKQSEPSTTETSLQVIEKEVAISNSDERQPKINTTEISEARTCLDFLVLALCQNVQLKAEEAISILTTETDQLRNIIILGEGYMQYQTVVNSFYDAIHEHVNLLFYLLSNEKDSMSFTLSTIALGFQSESEYVTEQTCTIFSKLAFILSQAFSVEFDGQLWDWFVGHHGGLDSLLYSIHRNQMKNIFIARMGYILIFNLSQNRQQILFGRCLRERIQDDLQYISFIEGFFFILSDQYLLKAIVQRQLIVQNIVSHLLDILGRTRTKQLISAAFDLVHYIWKNFFLEFQAIDSKMVDVIISYFEATLLEDTDTTFHTHVIGILFDLLQFLIEEKNRYFKTIYLILVSSLSHHFSQGSLREYILCNFKNIIHRNNYFPVTKLIKTFLEASLVKGISHSDFDFINSLSRYEQLTVQNALLLVDRLSMIAIDGSPISLLAQEPLLFLLNKYSFNRQMIIFLKDFISESLTSIYRVAKDEDDDFFPEYDRKLTIQLLSKIVELGIYDYNSHIAAVIQPLKDAYLQVNGYDDTLLITIADQLAIPSGTKMRSSSRVEQNSNSEHSKNHIRQWLIDVNELHNKNNNFVSEEQARGDTVVKLPDIWSRPDSTAYLVDSVTSPTDASSVKSDPLPNANRKRLDVKGKKTSLLQVRKKEIEEIKLERLRKLEREKKEEENERKRQNRIRKKLRKQYSADQKHIKNYLLDVEDVKVVPAQSSNPQQVVDQIMKDIILQSLDKISSEDGIVKPKRSRSQRNRTGNKQFFSKFNSRQRSIAMSCKELLCEIIDDVVSGEAKTRLQQKKAKLVERRRKILLWKKKKQELKIKEVQEQNNDISQPTIPLPDKKISVISVIQINKMKNELEKEEMDRKNREWEKKQRQIRLKRQKLLNAQLLEYRRKRDEVARQKRIDEEELKRKQTENEKRKNELLKQKREKEKQQIQQFKQRRKEDLKRREIEIRENLERETKERQKQLKIYQETKQKRLEEEMRRVAACIKIQRFWRKFTTGRLISKSKKRNIKTKPSEKQNLLKFNPPSEPLVKRLKRINKLEKKRHIDHNGTKEDPTIANCVVEQSVALNDMETKDSPGKIIEEIVDPSGNHEEWNVVE